MTLMSFAVVSLLFLPLLLAFGGIVVAASPPPGTWRSPHLFLILDHQRQYENSGLYPARGQVVPPAPVLATLWSLSVLLALSIISTFDLVS